MRGRRLQVGGAVKVTNRSSTTPGQRITKKNTDLQSSFKHSRNLWDEDGAPLQRSSLTAAGAGLAHVLLGSQQRVQPSLLTLLWGCKASAGNRLGESLFSFKRCPLITSSRWFAYILNPIWLHRRNANFRHKRFRRCLNTSACAPKKRPTTRRSSQSHRTSYWRKATSINALERRYELRCSSKSAYRETSTLSVTFGNKRHPALVSTHWLHCCIAAMQLHSGCLELDRCLPGQSLEKNIFFVKTFVE